MIGQMERSYEELKNKRFLTSEEIKERDKLQRNIEDYKSHRSSLEEEFSRQQEEKAKKVTVTLDFETKEKTTSFLNFLKAQNKAKQQAIDDLQNCFLFDLERLSNEAVALDKQETESREQEALLKKLKLQLASTKKSQKKEEEMREQLFYKEQSLTDTAVIRKRQIQELIVEKESYSLIVTDLCGMKILAKLQFVNF